MVEARRKRVTKLYRKSSGVWRGCWRDGGGGEERRRRDGEKALSPPLPPTACVAVACVCSIQPSIVHVSLRPLSLPDDNRSFPPPANQPLAGGCVAASVYRLQGTVDVMRDVG
ncbi:hypothetical protein E2C01_085143 [Portunus trituberculatus]|uniref:Uncharacterized protein n=1 Tax=Portunus trituberculatus TaxID=210409 RepID=A0A5B7J064_PORTR|nr:hypothetical protein [Portunus trituberculatus]